MVMIIESFGNVVEPSSGPTKPQFLDGKLLFLDTTTETLVIIVYFIMSGSFVLLGSLMIQRLNQFPRKHIMFSQSTMQATIILSVPMMLVGVRFLIEMILHDELASACSYILTHKKDDVAGYFSVYWFCSIVLTEFACYIALIYAVYIRKKNDWDRLYRLPLKMPKQPHPDMENLLGGLIDETE